MKTRKKISAGSLLFAIILATLIVLSFVACNDSKSKSGEKNADIQKTEPAVTKKRTGKALMKMRIEATPGQKIEKDKAGVYSSAEVMPVYPGGSDALADYIRDHIEYPQDAMDNDIEGTVMVEFVVDEKGNVSNVSTVGEKLGYGLEDEAVSVVSKISGWTPARVNNKTVKMRMRIPITYVIS